MGSNPTHGVMTEELVDRLPICPYCEVEMEDDFRKLRCPDCDRYWCIVIEIIFAVIPKWSKGLAWRASIRWS